MTATFQVNIWKIIHIWIAEKDEPLIYHCSYLNVHVQTQLNELWNWSLKKIALHYWVPNVACIRPPCCNVLQHVRCFWLKFDHFQTWANDTQHVATSRNRVAKYAQQVAPSNVAIYCLEIVQSFGQEFTWIHEIWGTIATVTDFLILFASINIMWCL